jgi:hypothetical protein
MHANQAEMKTNQEELARVEAKMDVNLKEMKEELTELADPYNYKCYSCEFLLFH